MSKALYAGIDSLARKVNESYAVATMQADLIKT